MSIMAKKSHSSDRGKDRHTGTVARTVRLHPKLDGQLQKLVEQLASDITTEIRIAIRERLESKGLWPPKQTDNSP